MEKKLQEIASHFALEGGIAAIDSLGEGFINDTFIIRTEGEAPDYILQRKNKNIFPDVPAMMDNIRRVTDHIRRGVIAAGGDPRREVMTVVPTRDGRAVPHRRRQGEYWAVSVFIERHRSPTTRPIRPNWPARAAKESANSKPSWPTSPSRWPKRSRASTTSATASCSGTRR